MVGVTIFTSLSYPLGYVKQKMPAGAYFLLDSAKAFAES
jgi:hypothetical protein